jgi:2'-5' RNA ligase
MTRINVALKPPQDVTTRLRELAEDLLPAAGALFRTGDRGTIPHLTLYMGEFEPADVAILLQRITSIPPGAATVTCDAQAISCTAGGYVEVAYAKSEALIRAQASVAGSVCDVALPVCMPSHVTPTDDQRRNLEEYRYELVGDSFRPHVTLGRLAADASVALRDQPLAQLSFVPAGFVVAEADEHGAARRVLMRTGRQ